MGADTIQLCGRVDTGGKPVTAVVVAVPDYELSQDDSGDFAIKIPLLATNATYRVKFIVDKQVIADRIAKKKGGRFELNEVQWSPPAPAASEHEIPQRKGISDDELRQLWPTAN
jgi:hypothetical protein